MKIELIDESNIVQMRKSVDFHSVNDSIALVENGSIEFETSGERFVIEQFEAMHLKKSNNYRRILEQPVKIHYLSYRSNPPIFNDSKIVFKDKQKIRSIIETINEIDNHPELDKYACKTAMLWNIYIQYAIENEDKAEVFEYNEIVSNAKNKMDCFFDQKLNLSELADNANLSYVQFYRHFKNSTGMSPNEYLISVRMKRAASMLTQTKLPIKTIAVQCGFSDEFYFSKAFKKYYTFSPSDYRKIISP